MPRLSASNSAKAVRKQGRFGALVSFGQSFGRPNQAHWKDELNRPHLRIRQPKALRRYRQLPPFWQPYSESTADALARSRPVTLLLARYPERVGELEDLLRELKIDPESTTFLPVMARGDWVALLDQAGAIVGYLPTDGFFR